MKTAIYARKLNLEHDPGGRCERCGQTHLRPGYCMALDPLSRHYRGPTAVTNPVTNPVTKMALLPSPVTAVTAVTAPVTKLAGNSDAVEERRAAKREMMRRLRAQRAAAEVPK